MNITNAAGEIRVLHIGSADRVWLGLELHACSDPECALPQMSLIPMTDDIIVFDPHTLTGRRYGV